MGNITRDQVEKSRAIADKNLLDYIDQQDVKVVEELKGRLVRAVKAVNNMIDDPQHDSDQTSTLRTVAAKATEKVRSVGSKVASKKPVSKQEVQEAEDGVAEIEAALEESGANTTDASSTREIVRVRGWGGLALFMAALGGVIGIVIAANTGDFFAAKHIVVGVLWYVFVIALGFTGGGWIGHRIETHSSEVR